MGATVCRAVSEAPDLELVAAVDRTVGDGPAGPDGPAIAASLDAVTEAGAEVAVDFTVASAAVANALWCVERGVHTVVGTSGIGPDALDSLERAVAASPGTGCLVAPNFAIGAVLMMRFAELAAPWFETAEIIELHHDRKLDAPSGTAVQTARRMAAASDTWGTDPTEIEVFEGARGGLGPAGIRIHSVRLRGLVAHQEVLLGTAGETLTIRHDSLDRESFMPGVLLGVRQVASHPGLTVGLDAYLGL
jgi:4-hydroxy-tetrahydrodipicolinate reductase